jgi:hypothetical protein
MTARANRRTRQKQVTGREPVVITASVVVLGVLVLICAGMLVAPLWTAVVDVWQIRPSGQECGAPEDASARQACYEELRARAQRHLVKGTNVPTIPRPAGQRSE